MATYVKFLDELPVARRLQPKKLRFVSQVRRPTGFDSYGIVLPVA